LPAAVADVVEGTRVAVVARRVGRLEDVRRAVHARPRAGLGYVACAGRGVADGARVGGRVNAPAAPVALIRAAHVVVVLACDAARGRRTRARPGLTAVPGGAHGAVVARGSVGHGRVGGVAGWAGVGVGASVVIGEGGVVGSRHAGAHPALAGVVAGAGVAVVAGRRVGHRHPDAHPTLAGVPAGAGVAVVARGAVRLRGAGADAALAGVVARAGVLVVARGAVEQRSVADAGAVLAGVGGGAGFAVVARRARVGGHGAARRAVAGLRVALVGGAGDRRADALAAAAAGVVEGAGVAVVARRPRVRRHGAARRAVAGLRVALVGGAGERRADAPAAAVAGVVEGAGVAVVAARARERRHRAARCPVAGPGVALVGGAGERRADALTAAVAGVVEGAGVAVVAARARERRQRAARRAVAGPGVARIRGAGDGGAGALAGGDAGDVEG